MLEPQTVWAIMPNHGEVPKRSLIEEVLRHVAGLTIVDDGSEETVARGVESLARTLGAGFVRLPVRQGKAPHYEPASMQSATRHPKPKRSSIDADGQHPATAIPAFVTAASMAELVIGDRFDDLAMPWQRRLATVPAGVCSS